MATDPYRDEDPVVRRPGHFHRPVAPAPEPVHDHSSGLTAYAVVKYGFILVMTIVILYFLARFVIPLFT
jgi:hypothetical protein